MDNIRKSKNSISVYLSVIIRWKKLLIINLLIISVITTVISFLIPEKYKADATIMLQEESAGMGMLSNMMTDVGSVLGGALFGGSSSSMDKIFGYLESRNIFLKIINKFNLTEYYDITEYQRDKTLKALRDDAVFDITPNGLISISMIHKDPLISAEIVNYFIESLDSLNKQFTAAYARSYREFVENRYLKNVEDLHFAEEEFEAFQKETGIYAVPEQLEIAFGAIAELEAQLAIIELEAELIKKTQGEDSPAQKTAFEKVEIMKEKLNKITKGEYTTDESIVFYPLKNIPKLQKRYLRLFREIEIQSKLLEFTLPIYEQALMEEQKNIPTIIVLDEPVPPELKDSPKKGFIILSVFFLALFFHLAFVYRGELAIERKQSENIFEEKETNFYSKILNIYRIK